MKGRPIDQLVYEQMFPKPRPSDPTNFHGLLMRHLIMEVRQEVHSFYGHLDTQEAKYPGLDYTHPTHRIRLSRWTWHRRLFRVFDALRLTDAEISGLTKWEGTKWAKERYEREQGISIRDTTADELGDAHEEELDGLASERADSQGAEDRGDTVEEDMAAEDSEEEFESVGDALNERLRERAARRNAGDTSTVMDEEWEQWLKNAIETGDFPFTADQISVMSNRTPLATELLPPRMLQAARAGRWDEIPDIARDVIRQTVTSERAGEHAAPVSASGTESAQQAPSISQGQASRRVYIRSDYPPTGSWRRTYSDLRPPPGEGSASNSIHRTAQPNA